MTPDAHPDNASDEYVIEIARRGDLLTALLHRPADAHELESQLDTSRSTIHRATKSLSEHGLIDRENGRFTLTQAGTIIAREVGPAIERIDATRMLTPFLNTSADIEIPIEHFCTATFTYPRQREPHRPVKRITEFIREKASLRMLSSVISPVYVEVAYEELLDGTEITVIFDDAIVDILETAYADEADEAVATGNFEIFAHDHVPFELFLTDDRIAMAKHAPGGGAEVFVETTNSDAYRWAKQVWEGYEAEAQPVSTFSSHT